MRIKDKDTGKWFYNPSDGTSLSSWVYLAIIIGFIFLVVGGL